jgi:hypothetical protein
MVEFQSNGKSKLYEDFTLFHSLGKKYMLVTLFKQQEQQENQFFDS